MMKISNNPSKLTASKILMKKEETVSRGHSSICNQRAHKHTQRKFPRESFCNKMRCRIKWKIRWMQ